MITEGKRGNMLDAWIIEELRKREEIEAENERPFLELPIPIDEREYDDEIIEDPMRGVIEIQL